MEAGINGLLKEFSPISLAEMDNVTLMTRMDSKYLFHVSRLPAILQALQPFYRVLETGDRRFTAYESLYFDTAQFTYYKQHRQGRLNRYKFRYRRYLPAGNTFFEIKLKNNHSRTVKKRVKTSGIPASFSAEAAGLIETFGKAQAHALEEKLWTNFERITLVSHTAPERVTIDLTLEFRRGTESRHFDQLVVAEVKRERNAGSAFAAVMKVQQLYPCSFSKYAVAVACLYSEVPHNVFIPQLKQLNNLSYGAFANSH